MSIAVPAAKRNGDLFTKLFTEARPAGFGRAGLRVHTIGDFLDSKGRRTLGRFVYRQFQAVKNAKQAKR